MTGIWDPNAPKCGEPKANGEPCGNLRGKCRFHGPKADSVRQRPTVDTGGQRQPTASNLDRAAELLAAGSTATQVATELGIPAGTVRAWLATRPELKEAVRQLRDEMLDEAVGAASQAAAAAVRRLFAIGMGEKTPPGIAVRALDVALSQMVKLRTVAGLEAELAELEALAGLAGKADGSW